MVPLAYFLTSPASAAPTLHVPSAVEPQFALQSAVNRVYDSRSNQSTRLMVPVASTSRRRSHDSNSNSSGRRSPSSSLSDKARRRHVSSAVQTSPNPDAEAFVHTAEPASLGTTPLALSRTITPADFAALTEAKKSSSSSSGGSRIGRALHRLTGSK